MSKIDIKFILISELIHDYKLSFSFPRHLKNMTEENIEIYVTSEWSPGEYSWTKIDEDIIRRTIISNSNKFDYPTHNLDNFDPDEWAIIKAKPENIWISEEKINNFLKIFNRESTPTKKNDSRKIEVLSATIQILVKEIAQLNKNSQYIKVTSGKSSAHLDEIVKAIELNSDEWWISDGDNKLPTGLSHRTMLDMISNALKFKNKFSQKS